MKLKSYYLILLTVTIFFVFISENRDSGILMAAPDLDASSENLKQKVAILLSSDNQFYLEALAGLQSELKTESEIIFLSTLPQDDENLNSYFKAVEQKKLPFYITLGRRATETAQKFLKKTPVLFSVVSYPKSFQKEDHESCGISMDISVSRFFETLKILSPDSRLVYTFFSNEKGEYIAGEGSYHDLYFGLVYKKIKINNSEHFKTFLSNNPQKPDAIFMINDPLYTKENFLILSDYCKKNKIILMTGFRGLVNLGATFGHVPNYTNLGTMTAKMGNRILNKKSTCRKEGIRPPEEINFLINEEYTSDSGIPIPETIKEKAVNTKLFDAGLYFVSKKKWKPARKIFEKILLNEPQNFSAKVYLKLCIENLSYKESKNLLEIANNLFNQKKYSLAIPNYEKIIKINPYDYQALKKIGECKFELSKIEIAKAKIHEKENNLYQALRHYIVANKFRQNCATKDITILRKKLSIKEQIMLKTAINKYKKRNYNSAIQILNNILLVNPNQIIAKEYLRLAKKKKIAIQELKKMQ
jgi:ABC-type uncharacterized transport system substrate-binding protein